MLGIEHAPPLSENQLRVNVLYAYAKLLGKSNKEAANRLPRGRRILSAPLPADRKRYRTDKEGSITHDQPSASVSNVFDLEPRATQVQASIRAKRRAVFGCRQQVHASITVIPAESLRSVADNDGVSQPVADDAPNASLSPGGQAEEGWPTSDDWDDFNEDEQYDVNAGWKQRTQEAAAEPSSMQVGSQDEPVSAAPGDGTEPVSTAPDDGADTAALSDEFEAADAADPSHMNETGEDNEAVEDDQEWEDAFAEEGFVDDEADAFADGEQAADPAADEAVEEFPTGGFAAWLDDDDDAEEV